MIKYLFLTIATMQFLLALAKIHSLDDALASGNLAASVGWGMAFLCQLELDHIKRQ